MTAVTELTATLAWLLADAPAVRRIGTDVLQRCFESSGEHVQRVCDLETLELIPKDYLASHRGGPLLTAMIGCVRAGRVLPTVDVCEILDAVGWPYRPARTGAVGMAVAAVVEEIRFGRRVLLADELARCSSPPRRNAILVELTALEAA